MASSLPQYLIIAAGLAGVLLLAVLIATGFLVWLGGGERRRLRKRD